MMSQCHGIKGGPTDEVFLALQEQFILWERGAPVGVDFGLLNLCDLLYTQERIKHRRRGKV